MSILAPIHAPSSMCGPFSFQSSKEAFYDTISIFFFPLGICRVIGHLFSKYVISQIVLQTSSWIYNSFYFNPNCKKDLFIETLDGLQLDATIQESITPSKKWCVFVLPNGALWQDYQWEYRGVNLLMANYRGTGHSSKERPRSFHDLVLDIESVVQYLLNRGVLSKDILLHGHSLGGAVASHVASHHHLTLLAQNTFSELNAVIPHHLKNVAEWLRNAHDSSLNRCCLAVSSTIDLFLSLPGLCFRVTYLFFSAIESLCKGELKSALRSFIDAGKTVLISISLTLISVVALISLLFTEKIARFCLRLNQALPPVFSTLLESPRFIKLLQALVSSLGWNLNGQKAIEDLDHVFITHPTHDEVVPLEASLLQAVKTLNTSKAETHIHPEGANHCTLLFPGNANEQERQLQRFLDNFLVR